MMAAVGIFVHDLGSREIRVRFDSPVSEAEDVGAYSLTSLTGYVPTILNAVYYDADKLSVKLVLDVAMTNGHMYSCSVTGLLADNGVAVTSIPFDFLATDEDRPHILGAYQSLRGYIDVICDRPVAVTATAAAASIALPGGGGPPVVMALVPWAPGQSLNAVRFSYGSAPAGTEYAVLYSNIADVSGNVCANGEIPLTLAYPVAGYADLVQAEVVTARIADVSNAEGFATAVLRVFFNCPMADPDIINPLKWAVIQSGAHVAADMDNLVLAANAIDDPSFVLLVNDLKAMLNNHLTSHAHLLTDHADVITTADAIGVPAATSLMNEVYAVLAAHYERTDTHLYADHLHPLGTATMYALANTMKAMFNGHLSGWYPISFSSAYSPLNPITNFSSSANATVVEDQFTWFADLHVSTDATKAGFVVSLFGIRSEDLASTVTDSIFAEPVVNPPAVMSVARSFRGATIRMNCDAGVQDVEAVFLRDSDNSNSPVMASATSAASLPVLLWAFNNVLHAYKMHISDVIPPFLGAKHRDPDTVNTVVAGDYATVMNLGALIIKANAFKAKFGAHTTSATYHWGQDVAIDAPDASDATSLGNLISDLRTHLTRHNAFGFEPFAYSSTGRVSWKGIYSSGVQYLVNDSASYNGFDYVCIQDSIGNVPTDTSYWRILVGITMPFAPMFHEFPGSGIVSANMWDLIVVTFDGAVNGNTLSLNMPVLESWRDNRPNIVDRIISGVIEESFEAVDNSPILTSAVARPGYSVANPSAYLLADTVELYMSKPMRNQTLIVGTNIVIAGAPMSMIDAGWMNERTICVQVTNMSAVPYSVNAVGLRDVAGNLIG
jgi:hypothetical protein